MKQQYVIDMDDNGAVPLEVALQTFMGKVFDAATESNCIGHGLNITKVEVD